MRKEKRRHKGTFLRKFENDSEQESKSSVDEIRRKKKRRKEKQTKLAAKLTKLPTKKKAADEMQLCSRCSPKRSIPDHHMHLAATLTTQEEP